MIEVYLRTIGYWKKDFKKVDIYIQDAIFCIRALNLIYGKGKGFLNKEIVNFLMPHDSILDHYKYYPEFSFIILDYLNKNKILNIENYNFFTSLSTTNQKGIVKLIKCESIDGDEFTKLEIIEMIKSHDEETLRHINNIFEWFFNHNPGLIIQSNVLKILSHKNIESLNRIFFSLHKINNVFERNSLNGCSLIRIAEKPENMSAETLKKILNNKSIYAIFDRKLGCEIYYLGDTPIKLEISDKSRWQNMEN